MLCEHSTIDLKVVLHKKEDIVKAYYSKPSDAPGSGGGSGSCFSGSGSGWLVRSCCSGSGSGSSCSSSSSSGNSSGSSSSSSRSSSSSNSSSGLYGVLFSVVIKGLPFSTSQLTNKGQPTHQPTTNQQKTLANASKPILNAFSRQQSVVALFSLL